MTDTRPEYPCPACGFFVFGEPPGSYAICDVCGWEDDHVQLANPLSPVGANGESLRDAQLSAIAEVSLGVLEYSGWARDPEWRPITEVEARDTGPSNGTAYFASALAAASPYYWRRNPAP